jgi:HTH-type transcriptional regulator, sugar sensing transcriptional regulator
MEIPLLTQGESKVYQALVELGESSIGNIIKVSGASHSKIYDILKRLSEKGLVSSINKRGKQFFSPAEPSSLLVLLNSKKEELNDLDGDMKEIIKNLKVRKNITQPKSILNSYEGIKGMKVVLDSVIDEIGKSDSVYIMGIPAKIVKNAGGYLKDWQKRRIKKGAKCKILADIDSESWKDKWWLDSKKKKLTFTKRSISPAPSYLVITNQSVTTIYFASNILVFKVEHPAIAQRYIAFFDTIWKNS